MAVYQKQYPDLFKNLPQELYRIIYDYDDTYRNVFNSNSFYIDLMKNLYYPQLKLTHVLIDKLNNESLVPEHNQYNIVLRTYEKNTNIIHFNLNPLKQFMNIDINYSLLEENSDNGYDYHAFLYDCWIIGFICNEQDAASIQDEIEELDLERMEGVSGSLSLYYRHSDPMIEGYEYIL